MDGGNIFRICRAISSALLEIEKWLVEETRYPQLKALVLKFLYVVENEDCPNPNDRRVEPIKHFYAKCGDELLAFLGCLKSGSFFGALHHLRGVIELETLVKYLHASGNIEDQERHQIRSLKMT